MFTDFNRVIIGGRILRDPELKFDSKGQAVTNLSLSVRRTWIDDQKRTHEELSCVDFVAWGKTAEAMCRHTPKGTAVIIDGRLREDTWVDRETGENRRKLVVVIFGYQNLSAYDATNSRGAVEVPCPQPV